ncbi:MAG: HNH endonuclease [Pseudomonadota bacterium]
MAGSYAPARDDLRHAAFARLRLLEQVYGDDIPWSAISHGFACNGEKVLLANRAVGIFKPKQMRRGALSIKTTRPRAGRQNLYADAEDADGTFVYSLQGDDPDNHFNRSLRECLQDRLPLVYFHAVAEGVYTALFPCFIESIEVATMTCRVSVAPALPLAHDEHVLRDVAAERIERRYALRETRVRLHQAEFRERVLAAYGARCAMTGLPVPELLEAAHIVPDAHERGVAEVNNGICLSRIHHRAFDANLIGVTPDYRIQVSERLLGMQDGVILEGGLKALNGRVLALPEKQRSWPSQELLDLRFKEFKGWAWG